MKVPNNYLTVKVDQEDVIIIDFLQVKKSFLILRALNHTLRRDVMKLLEEQGILTVTQIFTQLQIEQSVISQSLAIMRRAGIVKTERKGKQIYYQIHHLRMAQVGRFLENLLP